MPDRSTGFETRILIHLQRVVDPLRLRLLIEVGARGSISAAAEACRIGQPSASLHLRNLESAVGHRLIERDRRGSSLTPAGQVVVVHAARVLASLEQMADELRVLKEHTRPTLSVAVSTAASYLMLSTMRTFRRSTPEIDFAIQVASSTGVNALVAMGEVALGIGGHVTDAQAAGVDHEDLLDDEVVGIAAPGMLEARDGLISAGVLANHTVLVLQPGSSQRAAASRVLKRAAEVPRTSLLGSEELIKHAVRGGLGVAFLSRLAIREEVNRGELLTFRLRDMPRMAHPVQIARPHGTKRTAAHDALAGAVRAAWRAAEAADRRPVVLKVEALAR